MTLKLSFYNSFLRIFSMSGRFLLIFFFAKYFTEEDLEFMD